jgi:hypothetical protein
MNWLANLLDYFGRILLPARFRRHSLESRLSARIDRATRALERPHESLEKAADHAGSKLEGAEVSGAPPADAAAAAAVPKGRSRFATFLLWTLHLLLLAAVLVGLWYLNRALGVDRLLRSGWPALHAFWLPLLFLILYVLAWLGAWLWQLTGPDVVGWEYPDINIAWDEAVSALAAAGIDLRRVPLFLVLGRPEGAEDALFLGTELKLRVWNAPRFPGSPLRVYATNDAVFVTCAGASVLGRQTTLFAREHAAERSVPAAPAVNGSARAKGLAEGDALAAVAAAPAAEAGAATPPAAEERVPGLLPEDEKALGLLGDDEAPQARAEGPSRTFLKNTAEAQEQAYRLEHLCRLIARDRAPYCPLNGVLVLVPYAALADDQDTSPVATACRHDLKLLRQVVREQCPGVALVCDMEASQGFRELLRRLPAERVTRLGQRFPLLPDIDEGRLPRMVDEGTAWLTDTLLPSLVYTLFRRGLAHGEPADPLDGTADLYRLVAELRARRKRLARLLTRAFLLDSADAYLFGGVYLAPTGPDVRPTLTPGVMAHVQENQNAVSWTPQALAAELSYRRWTWIGWVVIAALVAAAAVLGYLQWR